MPYKIVILDGSLQPPMFIRRLMEGLAQKGHKVYLLHFGSNRKSSIKNLHYISLGSSSNNYSLIYQSFFNALQFNFITVFRTMQEISRGNRKNLQRRNLDVIISEINPDLIHVQWPAFLDVLRGVIEKKKYPVILSQRGYQINVKPFVDQIYFEKLAGIFPKLSGFHSVSKAIMERGNHIYNSPVKVNDVVYTGLDLEKLSFKETYTQIKKLNIISVGRPHWKKGLHDLVAACGILQNKNIDFELTIIGGSGNEEILFLANFFNLEEKIRIMGKLPQEEVYHLISNANLMVVSSVEEGIPNVLVEAMAMGIPVISTACGGVDEVIDHGISGWIVPTRNAQALAAQIEAFRVLPLECVEKVRKAAREKVEKQHSYKQMVEGMENLYGKVIGKREI